MALLACACILVYAQTSSFGFILYDDPTYVRDNPHIRSGITLEALGWSLTSTYAANWHPLTWVSHMLDVELFGMDPGTHHLVNALFHTLNTLLLFGVLVSMTGDTLKSAFVAAVFGVHPLHVESVAWISERKDVLSTLFWMLTLLAYARYATRPGKGRFALVTAGYGLGLMAKPMLVTLPFVLLLLDFWPLRRLPKAGPAQGWPVWKDIAPLLREKLPLFILAGLSCVVTFYAQKTQGAMLAQEHLELGTRLANALVSYTAYIAKSFWPLNLAMFYPHPERVDVLRAAGSGLALAALSAAFLLPARRLPFLATGWLWYLGTLVPVIGIVQVGSQAMADRYTYVPQIGLAIMLAWGVPALLGPRRVLRGCAVAAAMAALVVLTRLAWVQTSSWKDSITLFTRAIEVTGENYLASNNLGVALSEQGDTEAAMARYRESLRIRPDYVLARNNLAKALLRKGASGEAASLCSGTVRIDPGNAEARNCLGLALFGQGRHAEAEAAYREAIRLRPGYPDAYNNLGVLLSVLGRYGEAAELLKQALALDPGSARFGVNLGDALRASGSHDKAIAAYRRALTRDPASPRAASGLAAAFAAAGRYEEALEVLRGLAARNPDSPDILYNLACMLARTGRTGEALDTLGRAVDKGFKDSGLLMKDEDLASVRGMPGFRAILKRL